MKLGSTFTVPADSARVFELFLDPVTMRVCIPGCQELERVDDTHYAGRLVNEIAHVRFNASFSAEIVDVDVPREVRAVLKGEDRRLATSIKLDATLTVAPDGDGSRVTYAMELAMWGKLGRMGESILRRRTAEVEQQFVEGFTRACMGVPLDQVASGAQPAATPAAAAAAAEGQPEPAAARQRSGGHLPIPAVAAAAALAVAVLAWLHGRHIGRSGR